MCLHIVIVGPRGRSRVRCQEPQCNYQVGYKCQGCGKHICGKHAHQVCIPIPCFFISKKIKKQKTKKQCQN